MPRLDDRLKAVASQIRCRVHADIGSDHGHLLKALLTSGRIQRGIAIENKPQPHRNSSKTLAGYDAEVRLADGLGGLRAGEAESVSICGMGGAAMTAILDAHPDRIPRDVVLQPNRRPELVRAWGIRQGFNLIDERVAIGHWAYPIMRFERRPTDVQAPRFGTDASDSGPSDSDASEDPAYERLDREAALLFGPHLIRRWQPDFIKRLQDEWEYLMKLDRLTERTAGRAAAIDRLLRRNDKT